tara:strand:- start:554 stop:1600 length:1047 start_codon:yes stop_codon:yes gene_type:complete
LKKKIAIIIGARPQFIKHAPVENALKKYFNTFSIHTGQHYDKKMSDIFFDQLGMNEPTYMLSVGSASHGKQTGVMIQKIEEVLLKEKPDGLIVYGDTNSTLAGAIAASKLGISIIHIESGLRSFNKSMPEEINRIITDHISDFLFVPTQLALINLKKEGLSDEKIFLSGDVMVDSLLLAKKHIGNKFYEKDYILLTLHRPYNTDEISRLIRILNVLNSVGKKVIFPIHPRTLNALKNSENEINNFKNINFIDSASYFDFIKLQLESSCIITDSGGVQKEAYILKKKCITLRSETEWIETLKNNWNTLIFDDLNNIKDVLNIKPGKYLKNIYGNGNSSEFIAKTLQNKL